MIQPTVLPVVEIEARRLLLERMERFGWFPRLDGERRAFRLRAEVDRYWHLMVREAEASLLAGQRREPDAVRSEAA